MLGRLVYVLILAGFLASLLTMGGCGPRCACSKTMSELQEAEMAAESAETRVKELEMERMSLEDKVAAMESDISELQSEREALAEELDLLEAGY